MPWLTHVRPLSRALRIRRGPLGVSWSSVSSSTQGDPESPSGADAGRSWGRVPQAACPAWSGPRPGLPGDEGEDCDDERCHGHDGHRRTSGMRSESRHVGSGLPGIATHGPVRPVAPPCRGRHGWPGVPGIPGPPGPGCGPSARRCPRSRVCCEAGISAGQRAIDCGCTFGIRPPDSTPPRVSSNFLAPLVRRLGRIRAPRANRVRDQPKSVIHLGQGVLNSC